MRATGLRALRACAWLLSCIAGLAMADDFASWWLAGARGFPHVLASLGLLVCANALEHARALLALHAGELAGLRSGRPAERS